MDWCGHGVISAAIDMRVFLQGSVNSSEFVRARSFPPFTEYEEFSLSSCDVGGDSDFRYIRGVLKAMVKRDLPYSIQGMDLEFLSARVMNEKVNGTNSFYDLPVKKGLSSSAAMCVSIVGMVDLLHRFKDVGTEKLDDYSESENFIKLCAEMAYAGEHHEVGINCGQMDPYASAFGGYLYIDCSSEPARVHKLASLKDVYLVIGDTRQPKDTPRILSWLGERFRKREPVFLEGVRGIVEVVEEAQKELSRDNPDPRAIGSLMNRNQAFIENNLKVSGGCPISPSKLSVLIESALENGAYGAKVTGSGGGGCMVALCDEESSGAVAEAIERAGGISTVSRISDKGIIAHDT